MTRAMWLTDEYAIRAFRSVWRRQIELVMIIPHKDSIKKGYAIWLVSGLSSAVMRIIPYPPSFRSTAARTIDPAIGASTCALGSHRCRPYSGIFTMNAIIHASHMKMLDQVVDIGSFQCCMIKKFRDPEVFWMYRSATKRGNEPTRV